MRELFSRYVGPVIDEVLGLRCTSYGYQYSEIAGSLSSVYFCGGDCVEDVTSHLMETEKYNAKMTYKKFTGYSWRFLRWRARRRN